MLYTQDWLKANRTPLQINKLIIDAIELALKTKNFKIVSNDKLFWWHKYLMVFSLSFQEDFLGDLYVNNYDDHIKDIFKKENVNYRQIEKTLERAFGGYKFKIKRYSKITLSNTPVTWTIEFSITTTF